MSNDTANTPAPEATEPAITQEQILEAAEHYRQKVASAIVPAVVIDRLTRVHGFTIDNEQDANAVVKSAVELYGLKLQGLIDLEPQEPETTNPLVKAAHEVSNLTARLMAHQQSDQLVLNTMLQQPEIRKDAAAFLQLVQA